MGFLSRFERNTTGRDFVVGDIHGCFALLESALRQANFSPAKDRLFSVGDLVDRGPDSASVVEWLALPWFHAVRGNHDQMAVGVAAGRHDVGNYFMNGGGWFLALQEADQQAIAAVLNMLPVCIEVETEFGLIGIVHAEVGNDWRAFNDALEAAPSNNKRNQLLETAMWSRDRISLGDTTPVAGIERLYVGHTPVKEPVILGNVYYVDTGACFGRKLTLVCITDNAIYQAAA